MMRGRQDAVKGEKGSAPVVGAGGAELVGSMTVRVLLIGYTGWCQGISENRFVL